MATVLWIVIGLIILAALSSGKSKGSKSADSKGRPYRIDHPHYISDDVSECSKCGARFRTKTMVCPKCGARFGTAIEDDGEFIEEMELWDSDDD